MKLVAEPSFDRAFKKLTAQQKAATTFALARLPESIGKPHSHSGIGIRPFGRYFECRAGLQLRVLFLIEDGDIVLFTVGNHNDVARFIKNN